MALEEDGQLVPDVQLGEVQHGVSLLVEGAAGEHWLLLDIDLWVGMLIDPWWGILGLP